MKSLSIFLGACALLCSASATAAVPLDKLSVPSGFQIEVLSDQVPNARQMAIGAQGTLFVGTRREGKVYALPDRNRDGTPDEVKIIARGLTMPSGIAFREGDLYIGARDTIYRFSNIESRLDEPGKPEIVKDDLPDKSHHGWKHVAFGPDGRLYIPVGAPCNICDPEAPFASILSYDLEGGKTTTFAWGIRNSVGFDWHPTTGELWFTDNGRDMLGDDVPADELNRAPRSGLHFGYPYVHAGDIPDPEFGKGHVPEDYAAPALAIQAHSAALGMKFYVGDQFPERYRGAIFIAEHGSWNRSKKVGYRVSVAFLEGNRVVRHEPFVTGWLEGEKNWGRPNDVLVTPDGSLLISDDQGGVIYRVRHGRK
ncbi:MAG: PQQ-dependent sugar dehydrogenase [Pseudomonadales bacterium]